MADMKSRTVDLPVPCRFNGCPRTFKNEQQLKNHMIDEPEHEYCERCDECLKDWDDWMRHVTQSEKHIACPSCGYEFKSVKGMERHIKQDHRADQKLVCYGCAGIYRSAGDMIGHLEKGWCRNKQNPQQAISQTHFQDHINQKTIIEKMLKNEENNYQAPQSPKSPGSKGSELSSDKTQRPGGVILDSPIEEGSNSTPALQPAPAFPNQPSSQTPQISDGAPTQNANAQDITASVSAMNLGSPPLHRDGSSTSRNGTPTSPPSVQNSSTASFTPGSAWGKGPSAAVLKAPPNQPTSFTAGLRDLDNQYARDNPGASSHSSRHGGGSASGVSSIGSNQWNTRFWTPRSDDWDAKKFYNALIQKYECPHKGCHFTDASVSAFTAHCFDSHKPEIYRCPSCLKEFKSLQAIVSHCEAPSHKCHIRKSKDYAKFMDYITGGFLDASKKNKKGEVMYQAVQPNAFADRTKDPGFW